MTLLGKTISLQGITQKGKNRVRDHGNLWTVLAEADRVLFAPNSQGPWLFIVPRGLGHDDKSSRWVRAAGDEDFIVVELGKLT